VKKDYPEKLAYALFVLIVLWMFWSVQK